MSEIIAATKVRIEADTSGLKAQAEKEVNAAIPKAVPVEVQVKLDQTAQAKIASQLRLEGLKKELQEVLGLQKTFREAFEATGRTQPATFQRFLDARPELIGLDQRELKLRENILREQELAGSIARRRAEAVKAAAVPVDATDTRRPGGVGGFIRAGAAGRTGGIAGLLGAGARLGAVGFAATAAFQAVSQLQQSLRVTGDEAFTAQGKIRNLGAELLGGNFIGGFKALIAERKAVFEGDLGAKLEAEMKRAKAATDPLVVTEEKLARVRQGGADDVGNYIKVLLAFNAISLKQAVALAAVNKQLETQQKLAEANADAMGNYAAAVEKAGGSLERAFGPDSRGGPRGVGGVEAGRPTTAGTPVFRAGTGGPDVAASIRASINSRIQDEQQLAAARVREAKITQKIAKDAFDTIHANVLAGAADANAGAAAWNTYVQATTGVALATAAANAATQTAADAAQTLANQVANAQVAAIADPAQQATAALAQARVEEAQASEKVTAAIKKSGKNSKEAKEALGAYQIAVATRQGIENQIAYSAQQAAKAAAEAQAASNKAGREQGLENAITAAALTKRTSDDKKAFDAAIRYWVGLRNSATDIEAREAARAKVISLFQERAAALAGGANTDVQQAKLQNDLAEAQLKGLDTRPVLRALVAFAKQAMDTAVKGTAAFEQARGAWIAATQNLKSSNTTLDDLKKANARARAALTETTADDERLIRADIAYWKRRVAQTKGMGEVHQNAIREELRAEAELKGLVDQIKPTTTVFDLLTASTKAFTEHAGNVINAANRFTADSFTAGIRGEIGTTPNAAGRARLGLDSSGLIDATNNNTTALDRLTGAIKGVEPRGHPPAAGTTTVSTATNDRSGWGRWGGTGWAEARDARDARSGIN